MNNTVWYTLPWWDTHVPTLSLSLWFELRGLLYTIVNMHICIYHKHRTACPHATVFTVI